VTDVLARIVARKRIEVAERLSGPTIRTEPTRRSLKAVLRQPGARFIMEVKPKSPSGHVARHSPEAAIAAYAPVADAVSVLTDGEDFGGSLALLADMRNRFDGPILAKDFIVDPGQVAEARAHGADAVLCMLSVLDDAAAKAVLDAARALNMDVLVEVHDEAELGRALALGVDLIGINNRDLKTLATDLAVTERLAAMVPEAVTLISESGIRGRGDVNRLRSLVDGFLVGSHLMAASDIDLAARSLVFGPAKLCGLTRTEDVALVAKAGASHAGFIMVPGTPRAIEPDQAELLAVRARQSGLKTVGVFRNAPVERVAAIAERLKLDAVQLHGRESEMDIATLRTLLPRGTEIWAACAASDRPRKWADRTLFDNGSGGTGHTFDWSRIAGREELPKAFLAGGIGPANARAAQAVGAYGLDVGSAVEAAPGIKDEVKVKQLFDALRAPSRGDAQCA